MPSEQSQLYYLWLTPPRNNQNMLFCTKVDSSEHSDANYAPVWCISTILCCIRFGVLSLQPIKPDRVEIWAPWVINEHKLLSDKWEAQNRNIYCTSVRSSHKAAQAGLRSSWSSGSACVLWKTAALDSRQRSLHPELWGAVAPRNPCSSELIRNLKVGKKTASDESSPIQRLLGPEPCFPPAPRGGVGTAL